MSLSATFALTTTGTSAIAQKACIAAGVCQMFLGKDASVSSHKESGTSRRRNANQSGPLWRNLSLEYEVKTINN